MKFLIVFVMLVGSSAFASPEMMLGEWKLTGFIYRGDKIPPLNPKLNLRFHFFANGTDRLFWDRQDEEGFCERYASYEVKQDQLEQTIFAVNPKNRADCATDKDMQMGPMTSTKIEIAQDQLLLHMQLGDEELVYILKRIPQ